jgi:transposase
MVLPGSQRDQRHRTLPRAHPEDKPRTLGQRYPNASSERVVCDMGYSSFHETSNLCPKIVGKGARCLQGGLRSRDPFVLRRCQILLASARGSSSPKIAQSLGCASQTVRNAIRAFNEKGLDALMAGSSTPKLVHAAFVDANSAERLRGMLHRSPREFGRDSSLWTLAMASEAAFEESLTEKRVSGQTIRATLSRLLGIIWQRAKRWITSPDPLYGRKKG